MKFIVYSKNDCQYCNMAKDLLNKRGKDSEILLLDEDYSLEQVKTIVKEISGNEPRTFPQILREDKDGVLHYVGGFSELRSFMAQVVE